MTEAPPNDRQVRPYLIGLALLALALLGASRFWPTLTEVAVHGNGRYTAAEVMALADVAPGDPLLWVTKWRVRRLAEDPWVARARVIRHWPDTVSITVWERVPVLTDGTRSWARDGTELPGVAPAEREALPLLTGWGGQRLEEALGLVTLLAPYQPRVISYTPEGFDIELAGASLFTPSAAALEARWAAFVSKQGNRLAVYPWGVSDRHE